MKDGWQKSLPVVCYYLIALVPLALRGVKYRPETAGTLLRRNLLVYGAGGLVVPFPGIWIIDRLVHALGLA